MKKRVYTLSAAVFALYVLVCSLPALAVSSPAHIQPRFTGMSDIAAILDISSGGLTEDYGYANILSGYTADMTMALQRSPVGKDSWSTVKSWNTSGTGELTLDKSWYVTSGYDYSVKVTVNIYNSSGKLVDTQSVRSPISNY